MNDLTMFDDDATAVGNDDENEPAGFNNEGALESSATHQSSSLSLMSSFAPTTVRLVSSGSFSCVRMSTRAMLRSLPFPLLLASPGIAGSLFRNDKQQRKFVELLTRQEVDESDAAKMALGDIVSVASIGSSIQGRTSPVSKQPNLPDVDGVDTPFIRIPAHPSTPLFHFYHRMFHSPLSLKPPIIVLPHV